jgi:hypothetical protein
MSPPADRTATVAAPAPLDGGAYQHPPGLRHGFGSLLEMAARDGSLDFHPARLHRRYCHVAYVPASQAQQCAGCQSPASVLVDGRPLHLACVEPDPATPGAPGHAAARPAEVRRARPVAVTGHRDRLAGVLAADGLWLPEASEPQPAGWPRNSGEAYDLAAQHGLRQLWVHPTAVELLGLPARHGPNPQAPEEHPWARARGHVCDPPGLAAWMQVSPADGSKRRAVVLPSYENRAPWREASTGPVLLEAVLELADALPPGCNYYYSPNVTAAAVIRHHHTRGKLAAVEMPPPAADRRITHVARWSRTLMDEEAGCRWLHRYDVHGAQLAVWNVKLGLGPAAHVTEPQWTAESKKTAGYWLTAVPPDWRPDPRLPDLLLPWQRTGESWAWLTTPSLELLANDLRAPVTIAEAWLWPRSSAWLEASGKAFKTARTSLGRGAARNEARDLAAAVVKILYSSQIGNFAARVRTADEEDDGAQAPADELARPDANDMIISKALANDYRRMSRIGGMSGRWPVATFNDAHYYASDDPNPRTAAPQGMTLGDDLGQYSHEATIALPDFAQLLGERSFHAAVKRHLDEKERR